MIVHSPLYLPPRKTKGVMNLLLCSSIIGLFIKICGHGKCCTCSKTSATKRTEFSLYFFLFSWCSFKLKEGGGSRNKETSIWWHTLGQKLNFCTEIGLEWCPISFGHFDFGNLWYKLNYWTEKFCLSQCVAIPPVLPSLLLFFLASSIPYGN